MTPCPCGTGKMLQACCGPLLEGRPASTAQALMRSRYVAFVHGDIDYIQKTAAGEALMRFDRADLARSLAGTQWLGLEITDTQAGQDGDPAGSVTFTVRFRQHGQIHSQTERSQFRRIDQAWRYCSGAVALASQKAPSLTIGRNDPCHCGSGKKHKKCCGAPGLG